MQYSNLQYECIALNWTCGVGERQYKFEQFLAIYQDISKEKDTGTLADFVEGFKTFDREGQGFISMAEMCQVLCSLGVLPAHSPSTLSLTLSLTHTLFLFDSYTLTKVFVYSDDISRLFNAFLLAGSTV